MSHTFSNLLFHLVWSTKNREPLIKKEIKHRLHSYIRTIIEREGANLLFINGIEDHVHLLVAMPLTMIIPDLIEKIKPVSTKWFIKTFPEIKGFKWQDIENQEEHHKTLSFEKEFASMLEAQGIAYDKRYFLG